MLRVGDCVDPPNTTYNTPYAPASTYLPTNPPYPPYPPGPPHPSPDYSQPQPGYGYSHTPPPPSSYPPPQAHGYTPPSTQHPGMYAPPVATPQTTPTKGTDYTDQGPPTYSELYATPPPHPGAPPQPAPEPLPQKSSSKMNCHNIVLCHLSQLVVA